MWWILWVLLAIVVLGILPTMFVSWIIYSTLLLRKSSHKWGRQQSLPKDEEYVRLYEQGMQWRETYLSNKKDVQITNDGLALYGEYFDFGANRSVIIIPGRMEACHYSCHYAEPYRKSGWNVLTIDGRAHGLSEGHVSSVGQKEYRDILAWARFLHDQCQNTQVVLHGVCIGSSTAVFAVTDKDCPAYVCGVVVDGLYQRFLDSCRNHMTEAHRPLFPFLWETMLLIRLFSKVDAVHDGPIYRIDRLDKPILFLHSREDLFSTPEKAQELFDRCASTKKTLHWFEHGGHSRIRILNPEEYDSTIQAFFATAGLTAEKAACIPAR